VLADWLHVAEVWVGADFLFGRDRSGNFTLLRTLGQQHGFRVEKIDPVRYKDFVVSSTRIRRLVAEGRVDEAGALLGHHYTVCGVIVQGDRRGREIGFPTANLSTANELLPPHGVYATLMAVDGVVWKGVTNVGMRPTFATEPSLTVETHVLGEVGDLYGKRVRLEFVQRLRDERRFADVDALKEQIAADVRRADRLFDRLCI
jgi:riboflavin kinase/FMN adenylyltransferase